MSVINNQIIKQYFWYNNKFNNGYKNNTLPILYINNLYHFFTETEIIKEINTQIIDFDSVKYHHVSFLNDNYDNIINKLRKKYRIIFIDVNESSLWTIRTPPLEKTSVNIFDLFYKSDNLKIIDDISDINKNIFINSDNLIVSEKNNTLKESIIKSPQNSQIINNKKSLNKHIINDYFSCDNKNTGSYEIITAKIDSNTAINEYNRSDDEFVIIDRNYADF